MSFSDYIRNSSSEISATDIESLKRELNIRESSPNLFPLDVFHPKIKPFIQALNHHYDIPRGYIGLALLSAYSTSIGTSFVVTTNRRDFMYLPIWAVPVGISSSGKSLAIDKILEPLFRIQNEFDKSWEKITQGLKNDEI